MIIVTGSLAFDYIMDFPGKFSDHILAEKLHVLSLSFLVDKLKKEKGGTAGNIAYNLALLGFHPKIVGCAGADFLEYKKHLEKAGVDTSGIKIIQDEFTSSAFIMTDQADNQIIGFYPGAMSQNKNEKLMNNKFKEKIKKDKRLFVIISPNDPEAMKNFVEECLKNNIPYLYDPGMQLPRIKDCDLKKGIANAEIVIGNDYEMATINKRISNFELQITNNKKIIITTLGRKGSEIRLKVKSKKLKVIHVPPAKPKEVLDPTGAGDAFRAGFLAGYLRYLPLETCGKMGNLSAVYTVEKYGTQTHKYTIDHFCKRYHENFKESLVL